MSIITNDGRNLVGTIHGMDQHTNVILTNSQERIFSEDEAVDVVELGLYLIKGDTIAIVGEIDEELDAAQDLSAVRARPINPVVHSAF